MEKRNIWKNRIKKNLEKSITYIYEYLCNDTGLTTSVRHWA